MDEQKQITEQMLQKASEIRLAAKALQQKLQTTTDPAERKELARQMNDLFAEASTYLKEAKNRHWFEESAEREFHGLQADLED